MYVIKLIHDKEENPWELVRLRDNVFWEGDNPLILFRKLCDMESDRGGIDIFYIETGRQL